MAGKVRDDSEENPSLQKHIGCMNGLLQLFIDRRHPLPTGCNPKRLSPPGQNGQQTMELKSQASQKFKDINTKRVPKEKHRVSTESSRTSLSSSSCSSTFSSVDYNRTAESELSSFGHCLPPQSPSTNILMKQLKPSVGNKQQASDYHDIVKDSTYEEAQGLSVKIERKQAKQGHGMKHIDSPRPLHLSKSVKLTSPDSNLAKLGEAPMSFNREKDGSRLQILKDRPRFSYDGRESRETLKYSMKLKEIPRLSLDSREPSARTFTRELKTDYLSNNLQRVMGGSPISIRNLQQEQESNKRPSTVVAKLMGLEAFPGSMSEGHMKAIKTCTDENSQPLTTPRTVDAERQNLVARSPRNNFTDPTSPRLRNTGAHVRPIPSSRPPQETAPWRQDVNRGSHVQASISWRSPKEFKSSHTVYGEIEMRLSELQFKKPDKGLRALKHIIETMQKTKEMPEEKKDEKGSDFVSPTTYNNPTSSSVCQRKLAEKRRPQSSHRIPHRTRMTSPPKTTVITRPCNGTRKLDNLSLRLNGVGLSGLPKLQTVSGTVRKDFKDKKTAQSLSPSRNHLRDVASKPTLSTDNDTSVGTPRSTNASKVPHHLTREKITNSCSSGTSSPRLQQKQLRQVKKSHSTTQSSEELSRMQRGSNRQMTGSSSPHRTFRTRTYNLQGGEDESSEESSETRNFSHQSDMVSLQCERNSSLASKTDTEVTSTGQSDETRSTFHLGVHKNTEARLSGDQIMANLSISIPEQPSPVSVLDPAYYRDDSPSPVKKTSNAFQDDETPSSDETYWKPLDQDYLPKSITKSPSLRSNQKKPEFMEYMFQNRNPDHKYIYEMILASGVLHRQLHPQSRATETHSSGHTLNPKLFPFLEKIKIISRLSNGKNNSIKIPQENVNEKIHRKLVFDAVDEILASKMALSGFHVPWSPSTIFPRRSASGQELLREVFSQLEKLQTYRTENEYEALKGVIWENSACLKGYHDEKKGIVLDVERLIFKDLVVEIVSGKEALPHA